MKNTILISVSLLLMLLFACKDKQSILPDGEIPISDLPTTVTDYVTTNYPSASIVYAEQDDDEYEVLLDNCYVLIFDLNGNFLKKEHSDEDDDDCCEYISVDSLPANVLSYLATNFPGDSILAVERDDNFFEVNLSSCEEVVFDNNGSFIELDDDDCEYLAISDLPTSITDYVATNYPGRTIVAAKQDDDDDEFEIYLDDCTELEFDENGQFEEVDNGANYCDCDGDDDGDDDDD